MSMNYTPKSGKAEIHVTYGCTLACRHCNRCSYLRDTHTPDMTAEDVAEFLRQARELDWYPGLLLIGGEPTLHPEFDEICRICREFGDEGQRRGLGYPEKGLQGMVQLWSNQTTPEARAACQRVRDRYRISVVAQTIKQGDRIPVQVGQTGERSDRYEFDQQDMLVSPHDLGYGVRPHCWQHGAEICGISVDAGGYAPCAVGGAIAGTLGLDFRTKRLADLFDNDIAGRLTEEMCRHCGSCLFRTGISNVVTPEDWQARMAELPRWHGMPVSPTWQAALERRDI